MSKIHSNVIARRYICDECGAPVSRNGTGLGTWTCKAHPFRTVTVPKDLSGGKEGSAALLREEPVQVRRHTKVRVELIK